MLERIRAAEIWMNGLNLDPVTLRERGGMKGKKHFVELLLGYQKIVEFYRELPDCAADEERVRMRVSGLFKVVERTSYHDLMRAEKKQFREDVLSYLFACHLAEWFDIDSQLYLAEIRKILPRIYAEFSTRGVSPRMALIRRLGSLGLPATETMEKLVDKTYIRQRKPVSQLLKADVYVILHEISHLTDAGRLPSNLIDGADRDYLLELLMGLIYPEMLQDVDLLAEVLQAWSYLGEGKTEAWRNAVDFIAKSQSVNGSFGSYEAARVGLWQQGSAYNVDIGMYLHTTTVCVGALALASTQT